jgi:hypothetical protein
MRSAVCSTIRHPLLALMCACLLHATTASAQLVTGDILGTVFDQTGAVPGATVKATNLGTQQVRAGETNARGEYVFTLLPPGAYSVSVEREGYKAFVKSPVNLAVGDRVRVNALLEVGQITETVEVTGGAAALQTDTATLQNVVPEQLVQELPLNGRNFVQLAQIAPGANEGSSRSAGASGERGAGRTFRPSSALVVNAQSDILNNFMIDGLDNNERIYGYLGVRPSIDAIAEVNTMTGLYTAEVGRTPGGVVNVITKSGADTFRGSVFEYLRDDRLDAMDYFTPSEDLKPKLKQHQFGMSLGGPIVKGKTYFFVDYEGFRRDRGMPRLVTVPTAQERDYVEANRPSLSPIALQYFALYPAPNLPGSARNYFTAPVQVQRSHTFDARVDHHFDAANSIFARYSFNSTDTTNPGPLPLVDGIDPSGGVYAPEQLHNAHLNYLHLFNSRLLLELKVGYTRIDSNTKMANYQRNLSEEWGIPNINYDEYTPGLTPIQFNSGLVGLGDATFQPTTTFDSTAQLMAALSYTAGNHSVKVGTALIRSSGRQMENRFGIGQYVFTTLDNFLHDRPLRAQRANLMQPQSLRTWEASIYVQDNWRATSNLTLNLGLRYSIFTPFTGSGESISSFDPDTATLLVPGQNGIGDTAGVNTDYGSIAPRVGFAYTPREGTVIRGGFGLSFYTDSTGAGTNYKNQPIEITWSPPQGSVVSMAGGLPLPVAPPNATDQANLAGELSGVDRNFKPSYAQQFSLNVQQQVLRFVVSVGYVGVLTRREGANLQINQAVPGTCPPTNPTCYVQRFAYYDVLPNVTGGIRYQVSGGVSNYHGLQTSIERRYGMGLTLGANYTWAHSTSDVKSYTGRSMGQGWGFITEQLGWDRVMEQVHELDYSNSDFDVRHRFAVQGSYELPFGKGLSGVAGALVKGWRLGAIFVYQTGFPFTVTNSVTRVNAGNGREVERPNMVHSPFLSNPTVLQWFDTTAFEAQPMGTLGDEPRNYLRGPQYRHLDASVAKHFDLGGSRRLELRVEAFNVTNTPNFDFPNASLGNRSFGMISATRGTPRQLQFAARFIF